MNISSVQEKLPHSKVTVDQFDFKAANQQLALKSAPQRIEWSMQHLPQKSVLTSSFGAQSAVSLHLLNQVCPGIPVVLIDTGYLFTETYQFIEILTKRLNLNLQIYRAQLSAAWQEAKYGQLWTQGLPGIEQYNRINKVEPLQRALEVLKTGTWYAGIRREQSLSRIEIDFLRSQGPRFKMHPIADWSRHEMHRYLTKYKLPYHPLWEKGFVSIGDVHTTRVLGKDMTEEQTRFFGLKRECGIHEI